MKHIWFIKNELLEEAHDKIFVKAKKESTVLSKMKTLCKKENGVYLTESEVTPEIEEKYKEYAKIEFEFTDRG